MNVDERPRDYWEQREAEERDAALHASTDVARDIHLQLAAKYAARAKAKRGRPTLGIRAT